MPWHADCIVFAAMVGSVPNILSGAQNILLQSLKKTQSLLDRVQAKLASGKDVNSAIDNPSNFFASRFLSNRADDLLKLLDGISLNVRAINTANAGIDAILRLIDQGEALLEEARAELYSSGRTSLVPSLTPSEISAILAANPGVVYSPDSQSFYRLGAPASRAAANAAALSATLVEPPGMAGVAGVTGHLANITSQAENDFVNALAPGNAWIGGSDAAVEGEWRWTSGPEAGQQFWQGAAGGTTVGGLYARWGGGEPNNSGAENFVHMRPDGFWNDLAGGASYNYVIEWDSSLFVEPVDAALIARAAEYAKQYKAIWEQIDLLVKDAQFRGINLLNGKDMRTDFNFERSSFLTTKGIDATSGGLGLAGIDFLRLHELDNSQDKIFQARGFLRNYSASLAVDLTVISVRMDFTRNISNTYKSGAEDLVVSDSKEAAAELLALEVRQQLQLEALRLSTRSPISDILS